MTQRLAVLGYREAILDLNQQLYIKMVVETLQINFQQRAKHNFQLTVLCHTSRICILWFYVVSVLVVLYIPEFRYVKCDTISVIFAWYLCFYCFFFFQVHTLPYKWYLPVNSFGPENKWQTGPFVPGLSVHITKCFFFVGYQRLYVHTAATRRWNRRP